MQIIEWGQPLEARDYPDPEPQGEEVLLRVDVGDDHLARDRRRRDMHRAAADPAGADDHQVVLGAQPIARLFQRREGGDAGARVGRGETLRHALMR